jgi:UDP-GlcNAc3NAcA epimerase
MAHAPMRIVSIVGTRPQLIKAAVLEPILRARAQATLVDTGQHWDHAMAGAFFTELGLPRPEHTLGIGGGGHGAQAGRMLEALEPLLVAAAPDAVVVYGDTNSTLAGALAAAKLGLPVAHVEAGLRSFDRAMPEEINRVVADHLSRWCFAPTATAVANLAREGITDGVALVGDLMQDLAARILPEVRDPAILATLEPGRAGGGPPAAGSYLYATIHRAQNRSAAAMHAWAAILDTAALPDRPVILALHPGTQAALDEAGIRLAEAVWVVPPVGYRTSLALQLHAAAVLTDSGGIQREASWLGTPCLILRETTEWPEALQGAAGSTVVVGLDAAKVSAALRRLAPPGDEDRAKARARAAVIEPTGAGAAMVDLLLGGAATA